MQILRRNLILDLGIALGESCIRRSRARGSTSRWAGPFCVEYCLELTPIAGLGFAMGNVFWYD